MRPIDADYCKGIGATCIAKCNDNGDLIPVASIDDIPTMYKCDTCIHKDRQLFDEPCLHCDGGNLWVQKLLSP